MITVSKFTKSRRIICKLSPDNISNVSDYLNPFIAEAMKVLGNVNRFSQCIKFRKN
ncbi:hypothetical protein [Capnocytophaga sputigena]|uniref:hypothetical protein n=1 Tax=Capnocytophaga sputigena TaxID=1019 RepID=UPI0028D47D44|nr:hypothetical protein [Capnocytophaga sputigena]